MKNFIVSHVFILMPVVLLAYTNIVLKWQINKLPHFSDVEGGIISYFFTVFTNIWVISTVITGGLSLLAWVIALNRFSISYAYPMVVSLSFMIVALGGVFLMHEKLTPAGIIGITMIIAGVALTASTQS